jgi:hypothetical protein
VCSADDPAWFRLPDVHRATVRVLSENGTARKRMPFRRPVLAR